MSILFSLVLFSVSSVFAAPVILGGHAVQTGDPVRQSVVALMIRQRDSQALCTASIVAPHLAITAAHCVPAHDSPALLDLIFNTDIRSAGPEQIRSVDRIEIPREWRPRVAVAMDTSDVALLHFAGEIPASYRAADLLPFNYSLKAGDRIEIAGFGISDIGGNSGAGVLRKKEVRVKNANFSTSEVEFDQSDGGGACHGDSGGPAYVLIDHHPYLFGITSRGSGNCDESVIYTKISSYGDWFEAAVGKIHGSHP